MVPFSFAGHALVPLPEGALWWSAERALLVADLHLEKASYYARFGSMLPPYDSQETLARIAAMVGATGAVRVWCLGDSFHDADGAARLPAAARALLAAMTEALDWVWITGNHDRSVAGVGGRVAAEMEVAGVVLRHEAVGGEPRSEISGHFHPKLRVTARGRQVARRCFVGGPTKLILPALGALTGGLDVLHPAIVAIAGRPAVAMVPLAGRLLRFPLAA